jgi:hypothetical protein
VVPEITLNWGWPATIDDEDPGRTKPAIRMFAQDLGGGHGVAFEKPLDP